MSQQPNHAAQFCAARMAGKPVRVEYTTHTDDGVPYVVIHAVHAGDWRIPADWLAADAISDFEREARAVEMAAGTDEWGLPDGEPAQVTTRGMYAVAGVAA